ncbi:MAG: aminotransferase class V-fold PLP-dependent enzyme [Myxococcota bacterium]
MRARTERMKALCGVCPAGCWIEATVEGGRLAGIEPDPDHPLGMVCHRGRHAAEIVYSEHRLRHPMRRTGPKGTLEFERISWDEAYDLIAENLQRIKAESGPEAVSVYTGRGAFELSLCDVFQPAGTAVSSASNVLFPFGSPNTMGVGALCYVSMAMIAPHVTMGRMLVDTFVDIEHADLLLVWGANPATDSPPLDMDRLEAAAARGAEVVVIDPRRTETARRTGARWIPIRPGTDGALALGIIQVMLEEDRHDEAFAREWTHGFDDLARYVQHFRPEVVQEITGVPADTVRWLARRLAGAGAACPVMYTGLEYSNTGLQAIRAVHTAFALAGHLDVPGGIGFAMPDTHFRVNHASNIPNPDLDRAVGRREFPLYSDYRGESHAIALLDSVLEGRPYPIRALLVHGASLCTSWPQSQLWREALSKLDFVATIDRQLTADARWADVVLPATTLFEIRSYMTYGPVFRLRERVIEPVGEARNDYLIMAGLAARLGYGDRFPQTEEALLRHVLEGTGYTLEDVEAAGGQVRLPTPMMEYRKWEKGRLRPDGRPGFDTPTGKFEIRSTILEDYGYEPLPKYTEPVEGPRAAPEIASAYPLVLDTGARPQTDFRSQHHGIEGLVRDKPEPTVDMSPTDAAQRGIATGDLVAVSSPRGRVPFRARVTEDIVAGVVECSMGGGTPVGPRAWREWNVNELTDASNFDPISGFPVYKALLCEVERVEEGDEETRRTAGRRVEGARGVGVGRRASSRPMRQIHLDNNATTRMAETVRDAMDAWLSERWGNPSSLHGSGREAREVVEAARRRVAGLVGARPRRIVFTGGGSEADNLAVKGVAFATRDRGRHVVTSAIEHPAVLRACDFLEGLGWRVTRLPPTPEGLVRPEDLEAALDEDTVLVSVMTANNEVGTLQPIEDLCALAHARGALFHTDAVQAAGKVPIDVESSGVDLLTLSGHKIHGPQGVGALYVRDGVDLEPLIHGGKQERGLRAGTENVAGVVGMGEAADLARAAHRHADAIRRRRDALEGGVRELWPSALLNGHREARLPNTVNLTLPGLRGESLVVALDQRGVALSSGSACKAGSPEPTHVLLAMGRSRDEAHCSVRFSLSSETSDRDVEDTLDALERVLRDMQNTVRFLPCK